MRENATETMVLLVVVHTERDTNIATGFTANDLSFSAVSPLSLEAGYI